MERLALIAIAGASGALARYGLQIAVSDALGRSTVLGTLLVNISGAFLLGLFLALTDERMSIPAYWRPVIATGFLGAYTTFSTLMYESFNRFEAGDLATAGANLVASITLGLLATYLGLTLGRSL
jgi:fluoride exporter